MCLVENRRNFLSGNSVREGDIFLVDRGPGQHCSSEIPNWVDPNPKSRKEKMADKNEKKLNTI
jgi:hypothetical protein